MVLEVRQKLCNTVFCFYETLYEQRVKQFISQQKKLFHCSLPYHILLKDNKIGVHKTPNMSTIKCKAPKYVEQIYLQFRNLNPYYY